MTRKSIENCPELVDRFMETVCGDGCTADRLETVVDGTQTSLPDRRKAADVYVADGNYIIPPYDGHGYCGML
ncbi:MAG TPA: hypothetical protein VJB87_04370 [Candidatus Nanoarchaeia archaeon]|nr:hypothetical protein [Candidatus Nanoarchaeia archaeon]